MGKGRLAAEQKIAAFEVEMNEYAKTMGRAGVVMTKRFKIDIIHYARRRQMTIDEAIEELRKKTKDIIQKQERSSLPAQMPTLH